MVDFSFFLLFLVTSAVFSIYQSPISEGAFFKYEVSVFGQPKRPFIVYEARKLYERFEIPMGRMLFLASVRNATGRAQAALDAWEMPSGQCGIYCSADRIRILVAVTGMSYGGYVINYTVIFSNFSAVGLERSCGVLAELIGPPSEVKDGNLVWRRDSLTLFKIIVVDVSSWTAIDVDSGKFLGEWLFWLSPFDLSVNYTLILAGINWDVPAGLTPNLSGIVGYVLYLNASNTAPKDYVVGGAKIEKARTLAAYSYPLLYVYQKVLKGGRVSEEFKSSLRRYGCSVVQHPNSTVEVLCETFLKAAARVGQWKAWKVVPISMWVDPSYYQTLAAVKYGDLYLAMFPIDFYVFVYDRQTGLLLEASHDPSIESWWGYAIIPSAYLTFGNYTLSFTALNGLINITLVETNVPLHTPSLGSAGKVEADFAYALLAVLAALLLLVSITKRWK